MINFMTLWAFSSLLSIGMDEIALKEFVKKIGSAGYKFNFTNLINFVKKINICDKSDKGITSDDNINYSNLVPLYNVAKSLSNACIITQRFDYLLSVFKTLKIIERMTEEEKIKYKNKPSLNNLLEISLKDASLSAKDEDAFNEKFDKLLNSKDIKNTKGIYSAIYNDNNNKNNNLFNLLYDVINMSKLKLNDLILLLMTGNFIYSNQYIVFSASFSLKNEVALSITISPENLCEISKCVLKTSRNGKNNYRIFMEKIGYNEIVDGLISESNVETNEICDDININDLTNKYLNIEEMPEKIRKKYLNLD